MNNNRPTQHSIQNNKNSKNNLRRKNRNREAFLGGVLIYLIFFAILFIITVICVGCSHNYKETSSSENGNITVDLGDTVNKSESKTYYTHNGKMYVNFSELAIKCELTVTGSETEQTFIVSESGEYIKVSVSSDTAIINGESAKMPDVAILRDTDIWLCVDFVSGAVNGVDVKYDIEKKILSVKRKEMNASTPDNPIYEPISFKYYAAGPLDTITDNGIGSATSTPSDTTQTPPTFKSDLSKYEQYMNPTDPDQFMILVNKENKLSQDYAPTDLTLLYKAAGTTAKYKMVYTAAMAFEAMVKEAAEYGYRIVPKSGYRSYNTQVNTFQNWLNYEINNAKKKDPTLSDTQAYNIGYSIASRYSAPAGASEHQLGLAIDVNELEETFGNTAEGKWLAENCYKFGFILRYPKDKTDITGYDYEPWHFRFVGRYHATKMHELGMCHEEYIEYLNRN